MAAAIIFAVLSALSNACSAVLVIVATQIGIAAGQISRTTGAALLAAGLLSATLFPPLAVRLLSAEASVATAHPARSDTKTTPILNAGRPA